MGIGRPVEIGLDFLYGLPDPGISDTHWYFLNDLRNVMIESQKPSVWPSPGMANAYGYRPCLTLY
jgi:hypothetical protein